MVATPDSALIASLQDASLKHAAFHELVKAYQRMLYQHIRRMVHDHEDADDVLQNTFIKAWNGIANFRGDASLKTWLYRIASNEAITHLNKQKRRGYTDLGDLEDSAAHSNLGGRELGGEEIQQKLQAAIATLPERQAMVFSLRYFEEMPYEQIATITGVTVGALKASFHHAVKKVEKILTND